ncbi:MAG: helix-turn-helix transcriptional regulator [Clostridiales bacterium]|jgi:DNA-binding HxlR family transcriptional regulator|nr:helix-turn-helix transcriptional regulator [Clostridiales bacterium]
MKRKTVACPVEEAAYVLNNPWKILIVRELCNGPRRFGELRTSVNNISPRVLSGSLRDMEDNGLLTKKIYAEVPPHTEYALTSLGQGLITIVNELARWGLKYQEADL